MRDYRFDVARVVCMTYIIAWCHLYAYIHPDVVSAVVIPSCASLTDACLGLFTFISGFLLGKKYIFGEHGNTNIRVFYKKRILRIIPLFLLASIALFLIGFNGSRATMNGVLCLSPFITPRPHTLWYIPVILFCYFISPIISRNGFRWRVFCTIFIIGLLIILRILIPTIDFRLIFNFLFYGGGLICAKCYSSKYASHFGQIINMFIVFIFLLLLVYGQLNENYHSRYYRAAVGGLGVFAILYVCGFISKSLFGKPDCSIVGKTIKTIGCKVVLFVSYASMACYMFHRLFFYIGEKIYNPNVQCIKWLYMSGIVFPIMIYLSFYIQKYYDHVILKLYKSK